MSKVILMILDGFGISKRDKGNAIKAAKTPVFDMLLSKYPHTLLDACELAVGIPKGSMGGSEVGHLTIGAGRIIDQPIEMINKAIMSKQFFSNSSLDKVINHAHVNNGRVHIYGLLSDGGVHSHISHLIALIDKLKESQIVNVYFHIVTDGRDTPPKSALKYLDQLDRKIKATGVGQIATIQGRYFGMDRDNNWDRIKLGYDAIVNNIGEHFSDYNQAINDAYKKGLTDEFIRPIVIGNDTFNNNDVFINFNFRKDREVELMTAMANNNFNFFETKKTVNNKYLSIMYIDDAVEIDYMYKIQEIKNTLGEYISEKGLSQLRLAETEKYYYVTSVFDGLRNLELLNSNKVLIPSKKVATFDLYPKMSAEEITNELILAINNDNYDFILVNYANLDMLGHTGNFQATVEGIEFLDECLGKVYNKIKDTNTKLIITADHGNADYMLDDNDNIVKSHSMNKVPFIICGDDKMLLESGGLSNVAATVLALLELEVPIEYNNSLIKSIRKD